MVTPPFHELVEDAVRAELDYAGAEPHALAEALVRVLPQLCDRRAAHALVEAVYDARNSDLDRALPMDTGPFEPLDEADLGELANVTPNP